MKASRSIRHVLLVLMITTVIVGQVRCQEQKEGLFHPLYPGMTLGEAKKLVKCVEVLKNQYIMDSGIPADVIMPNGLKLHLVLGRGMNAPTDSTVVSSIGTRDPSFRKNGLFIGMSIPMVADLFPDHSVIFQSGFSNRVLLPDGIKLIFGSQTTDEWKVIFDSNTVGYISQSVYNWYDKDGSKVKDYHIPKTFTDWLKTECEGKRTQSLFDPLYIGMTKGEASSVVTFTGEPSEKKLPGELSAIFQDAVMSNGIKVTMAFYSPESPGANLSREKHFKDLVLYQIDSSDEKFDKLPGVKVGQVLGDVFKNPGEIRYLTAGMNSIQFYFPNGIGIVCSQSGWFQHRDLNRVTVTAVRETTCHKAAKAKFELVGMF